ncbi:MAG TPA: VOC family protein [Steroidobacteraceae bacterium]|nr:VOC family protein [Steroidobacteraceae bacterium]HRX88307.1 VOC family protein [Steroidobacteraceae bacterium]
MHLTSANKFPYRVGLGKPGSLLAVALCMLAGLLVACTSPGPATLVDPVEEFQMPQPASRAYAYVVVSVADIEQAIGMWVHRFGMRIVTRRTGNDPGLARFWGLQDDDIIDQALLLTPGATEGGVHLVQFKLPGPAVRADAAATDLVPKSIDVVVRDLASRYQELTTAGFTFRSEPHRLEANGIVFHETHMPSHDGLNVVLLEIEGQPALTSPEGYGVAPQIVATTPDNIAEKVFFESVLNLVEASYNRFSGPEIEKTVGLPSGASLDIRILGDPTSPYGRLELVQYEGAKSQNLYPRTAPPARGMLSVTYFVPDLAPILARGAAYGIRDAGQVTTIFGTGHMAQVRSPAGLRIDLLERPANGG